MIVSYPLNIKDFKINNLNAWTFVLSDFGITEKN